MDLLDHRAAEAIAVESRALDELEAEEEQEVLPVVATDNLDFHLSPTTWGALDGLPDEFWEIPSVSSFVNTGEPGSRS